MFSFMLACLSLFLSIKALQFGMDHAKRTKEKEDANISFKSTSPITKIPSDKEKFYSFVASDDSAIIFKETEKLLNKAINEALTNEQYGNLGHNTTLSSTIYNFKIQLTISPTEFKWEVYDLSQESTLKSYHMYTMRYDRSRKIVIYDEFRLNEGSTYSHDRLLNYEKYNTLPFSFKDKLDKLNNAGWNKVKDSTFKEEVLQPLEVEMKPLTDEITTLLNSNKDEIDVEILNLFESILSIIKNILVDEQVNEIFTHNSDIEFKHDLKRLLENEISKILHIYLELDANHKEEVKNMTIKSLEKAHSQLVKKYTSFQQERVSALKQTHLVMKERYE